MKEGRIAAVAAIAAAAAAAAAGDSAVVDVDVDVNTVVGAVHGVRSTPKYHFLKQFGSPPIVSVFLPDPTEA